ncbi:MAG: hypothetical protein PHT07_15345 [Paludibacter sp.]|nr:hypothetical protein [Paludibacter sp.]
MPHTVKDLENLIEQELDNQVKCGEMPYVCGMMNTQLGRIRLKKALKSMILDQGNTSLMDCLNQIEHSHQIED